MLKKGGIVFLILIYALTTTVFTTACASETSEISIVFDNEAVTINGSKAGSDSDDAVYLSNDIVYYEDRTTYDSGNPYGEGEESDRHSAAEALLHTVVNITAPGTYRLSGTLSKGQVAVDLGKDSKYDQNAVVALILDNANITCTVAPAIIFYNVYECNTEWVAYDDGETDAYNATSEVDTKAAGANLIIADDSVNNINGSHVARIYKDEEESSKKHKYDGALYSKRSMNIDGGQKGNGVVNLIADNEGIGTEMHLTLNGGKFNIFSNDDGVNVNEDGVSVFTVNGGSLHILAGLGKEGDGVDSNGYLVINGGTVIAIAKPQADSGLDSDMGSYVNGGYVVATGSTMDWAESNSNQVTMNLQFASQQNSDEAIVVTNTDGEVVFAYDPDKDETTGSQNRGYSGAVVSCPEFVRGETYNVYIGGDIEGEETDGLYDAKTIISYDGGIRQEYTGTDFVRGHRFGGGMRPPFDGEKPENFAPENMPAGFDPENMPKWGDGEKFPDRQNNERPEMPRGNRGERPELPDGEMPPAPMMGTIGAGKPSTDFYMNDKVNAFSGVADEGTNSSEDVIGGADAPTNIEVTNGGRNGGLPFKDIKNDDWYYSSVDSMYNKSLLKGVSTTEFMPNVNMTRAMVWTILARIDGKDSQNGDKWYSSAMEYVESNNISDATMPDEDITKEQLITMLWRLAGSPVSSKDISGFKDSDSVSAYASQAVSWAVEKGIVSGNDEGKIEAVKNATRAESAKMIHHFLGVREM